MNSETRTSYCSLRLKFQVEILKGVVPLTLLLLKKLEDEIQFHFTHVLSGLLLPVLYVPLIC